MTTDNTSAPDVDAEAAAAQPSDDDPTTEIARLKSELAKARKWEDRAKSNAEAAKELARIQAESATDMEKAVKAAADAARTDALKVVGARLVDAEVRAAVSGRNIDVKALLEGLDRSRFLDDDGEPDVEAITKWVDRIAPASDDRAPRPRVPAGVRDSTTNSSDGTREFIALRRAQLGQS